jgi:hypothetical protein
MGTFILREAHARLMRIALQPTIQGRVGTVVKLYIPSEGMIEGEWLLQYAIKIMTQLLYYTLHG